MNTVAIFGGTFNPVHSGHIEIIDALCKMDDIEKVLVIPTKIPPHKNFDYLASEDDRLNMCEIACRPFKKAEVSNIEFLRAGKSYTIDTVADIKKLYPENKIAITIGADMVTTFTEWKDYKKLLKDTQLIVFYRAGVDKDEFNSALISLKNQGANIRLIDKTITEVSSSKIRDAFHSDLLCDMICTEILSYIKDNNLYGTNNG